MEYSPDLFPADVYHYSEKDMDTERINCRGHFLFIFVKSGFLRTTIDGKNISCTSNEFIIALCRHYYQIIKFNKKAVCYLVRVQWQFITDIKMTGQFIELLVSKQHIKIFPDAFDSSVIMRIMKLLHYYYQAISNPSRFPMAAFTAALSLLVYQAAWQQDAVLVEKGIGYSRRELLTMQFLKLLIQHHRKERGVTFYAKALCVSKGYMNKAIREVTGKTVMKCITEVIISEAKYLLLSTEHSIEAISEELHFNSAGSFSRFFKKETEVSPTDYRKDYGK